MTSRTRDSRDNGAATYDGAAHTGITWRKRLLILILMVIVVFFLLDGLVVVTAHRYVLGSATSHSVRLTNAQMKKVRAQNADCILVLGAGVRPDGTPTKMLEDRLEVGLYLYQHGAAKKLLLSGDNGQIEYNEVRTMKNYMLAHGVPGKDIFLDHAGFSTYESMYRAGAVFQVKRAIVVTQTYHEYRALYAGARLGLQAAGVGADQQRYSGQAKRDLREQFARVKDVFQCLIKPDPSFLGTAIPITGNGKVSW